MSLPPVQEELIARQGFEAEELPPAADKVHGRSPSKIALDRLRHDKVAVTCFGIFVFFLFVAIFAPLLVKLLGVEYNAGDPATDLDALGFPNEGPPFYGFTWEHPLGLAPGTGSGNDNLAQWIYGARTSMGVAIFATVVSTIIGIVVGLLAGYSRGWLDRVISWVIDFFLSLPFLLVALSLSPIIVIRFRNNPDQLDIASLIALLLILAFFGWMQLARLVRGEVLSLREREFVQAAQVIGVPTRQILFKELLPNLLAPIVVSISLSLPAFVAAEAALAYLGVGVVGIASWGQTINNATPFFDAYPLYLWAPVTGVLVLVVALNLLGDSVRDAFDPKTRR